VEKVIKIKKVLPKDENFQIWNH